MTNREYTRLYFNHMKRAGDFGIDMSLCRASIANHARRHGRTFFFTSTNGDHQIS